MPFPLPPETVILEEMKALLFAANIHTVFGLSKPLTVRHYRHRQSELAERPGLAIRYVSSEIDNERGAFHTSSEQCRAMTVDLVFDSVILAEVDGNVAPGDANDATGWDRLLGVGHYAAGLCVRMASPLRLIVDDLLYGDVDPDENTQPDEGRLAISVVVLYRTLFEDPLLLLGPEQNG